MATTPLIGISGRTKTGAQINVKPDSLRGLEVDLYFCDYARGVIAAGGLPVFLPSSADPADYANRLDGLLLSGGTDIDPARYSQEPCAELLTPEPARDAFEMVLLDGAAAAGMPVLGICRGIQVLNVHGGGTLHQHTAPHACYNQPPNSVAHRVDLAEGSLAASLYGPSVQSQLASPPDHRRDRRRLRRHRPQRRRRHRGDRVPPPAMAGRAVAPRDDGLSRPRSRLRLAGEGGFRLTGCGSA